MDADTIPPLQFTLLANGLPSGSFVETLVARPDYRMFREFPSSSYWPFHWPSSPWAMGVRGLTRVNDYLHGFVDISDVNRWPVCTGVPFLAYIGDEWPQAPVGIVHVTRRVEMHDRFADFSLLIERPHPEPYKGVHNHISGDTHGTVVQAGHVGGGVNFPR